MQPRENGASVLRVRLSAAGGFEWTDGSRACRAEPDNGAIRLEGGLPPGWRIVRASGGNPGLVVVSGGPDTAMERGRSTRSSGRDEGVGATSIVTEGGRLFHLLVFVDGEIRWELRGDEGPGAYLVARGTRDGWEIEPTVAGSFLEIPPELEVLIVAEIVATARRELPWSRTT